MLVTLTQSPLPLPSHLPTRPPLTNHPLIHPLIHLPPYPLTLPSTVAEESRELCNAVFGDSPEVNIMGDDSHTFTYVPGHLKYMLSELLKNSLRATCTFHGIDKTPPPVEIVIAQGKTDLTIKISDRGGGIPFKKIDQIWSYCLTSDTPTIDPTYVPKFRR